MDWYVKFIPNTEPNMKMEKVTLMEHGMKTMVLGIVPQVVVQLGLMNMDMQEKSTAVHIKTI